MRPRRITSRSSALSRLPSSPLNDEWGRQAAEANSKLLEQKGVKVLSTDYFLPGESEFGATLTKIKAANPDAIFVASNTREAILIAKKIQELGMTQKRIGVGAWPTNTFIARAGDAGMGWTVISQYVPTLDTPQAITSLSMNLRRPTRLFPTNMRCPAMMPFTWSQMRSSVRASRTRRRSAMRLEKTNFEVSRAT